MKNNHYANAMRELAELKENVPQKQTGGIKIFALHIPMEIYLAAKEMANFRNISMKKYVLEGLCKVIEEDRARGTI